MLRQTEPLPTQYWVERVSVENIDGWWPAAVVFLKPAIDRTQGRQSVDAVYKALKDEVYQLWILHSNEDVTAAAVTHICIYHGGLKTLRFLLMGGDKDGALKFLPQIEKLAKERDCAQVEVIGRRGWERELDYEFHAATLTKDL